MLEPNNPEWGLCDHYLLPADYRDDEEDYDDEWDDYDERYGYSRQTAQAPTYHT